MEQGGRDGASTLAPRRSLAIALALGALALLGAAFSTLSHPPRADAQTIGANLNRTPNVTFDCTVGLPPIFLPQFGAPSCTFLGTSATPGATTLAPFPGGVATRVRVRTAAPTGPMRVTVLRSLREINPPGDTACCFYAGQSQVFTPRANATTAVNVFLPMTNTRDDDIEQIDSLGITVLNPGTAIPGQTQPIGSIEGSLAFYPQVVPADAVSGRLPAGSNLVPLLNADFTRLCGGGAAAAGENSTSRDAESSGATCLGGVTIRSGRLAGSRARVPLVCNLAGQCRGTLVLQRTGGGASAAGSKTVGKKKIKISSGGSKTLKVKLNKKGKKLVKGKKKVKVKAKAKIKGGPNETKKVKLKK